MPLARRSRALRTACIAALAACAAAARATPVALDDEALGQVAGQGIAIAVHLQLNVDRATAGFDVGGTTTYAVVQGFGGVLDLFSLLLTPSTRANGPDYLSIGLPGYIGATYFGAAAIGAQTDPTAPVASSYGAVLLNGSAAMTGQLMLWPH